MECSWYTRTLACGGRMNHFALELVIKEFSQRMKTRTSHDPVVDRKLEAGDGEDPIFVTRVRNGEWEVYWKADKNNSVAYILALSPGGKKYLRSVKFLEAYTEAFDRSYSYSQAFDEAFKKYSSEEVLSHW